MDRIRRVKNYVLAHPEIFTVCGLAIIFYFIFFHNIGTYALMDVDETRYVSMAKDMFNTKDFMTLYLNNEYFFEKPPLYFWGECLSFGIFGAINEFTARFPVALYGTLCAFFTYFMGRKIVSRQFGVISSLILATSLEFIILAKFAILDIVVSTCICFSLYFGMLVYFCKENHKKYFWWLFYIFSGLAVMAKGIPGFVVPFGSMFFISIISKRFKEIFKPTYFVVGMILFLLISLPWHIIMLKTYPQLFWDEYIIKHHLARFLGSEVIHRSQPFYFYFITLLWGGIPWIISALCVWIKNLKNVIKEKNWKFDFQSFDNSKKYLTYNLIIAIFTLLFFSSSETKLITYILPIFASLSVLMAYVWLDYINKKDNEKLINITVYILGGVFMLASIVAIFTPLFLPEQLNSDISAVKPLCIVLLFATGLGSILFAKRKLYLGVFVVYVLFMTLLSGFGTGKFFEVDYKFGQDDLMKFAQMAKEKDKIISTYKFSHKYSLIYYGKNPVKYGLTSTPEDIVNTVNSSKNDWAIIRNKHLAEFDGLKYNVIQEGRRYTLIGEDE